MNIAQVCSRPALTIRTAQPLAQAAQKMIDLQVGALVVLEDGAGSEHPVGMITDRDIVCAQLSHRADIHCLTVGEVMSAPAFCIAEEQGVEETIAALRARGCRRAPVTDGQGRIVGVIALDDLLPAVTDQLNALSRLMSAHRGHGSRGQ